jgi:DNA repair exonuclease SbcCD nuclease subunit
MKIALITDTHFGIRNDSPLFVDHFLKFFEDVFFPYLDKHNITEVIHLGDLLDRRKFVNINILSQVKSRFFTPFNEGKYNLHCIIGNHDTYYRNTNDLNSVRELFNKDNITIYDKPQVVSICDLDLAFLPWINKSNEEESLKFIKKAKSDILMGHLELKGYQVLRGVKSEEGIDCSLFERYDMVLSGHFHCRHEDKNIKYLGTPYQMTIAETNERKGFHVLDCCTRELEFIENPYRIFHSIRYDDRQTDMTKIDFTPYKDGYIKLFIDNKTKPSMFDKFLDKLYSLPTSSVTIMEETTGIELDKETAIDTTKDTISIINDEIDTLNEVPNKDKLKKIVHDLYLESINQ